MLLNHSTPGQGPTAPAAPAAVPGAGDPHVDRDLGGRRVSLVGSPQGAPAAMAPVGPASLLDPAAGGAGLLTISPSTMDRRLQPKKRQVRRRLYGRTKPGTLLKHHIPIRTDHWDLTTPGFTEVDLVSRSGNWADGEGLQSLNLTDILTGWVESSALWGKSQRTVRAALEELRAACPSRCAGSTRTTARNSSTRSCCSTAAGGRSPSPAGAPTRRTTTRTPSRRIGRMCGSSWAGIAMTRGGAGRDQRSLPPRIAPHDEPLPAVGEAPPQDARGGPGHPAL